MQPASVLEHHLDLGAQTRIGRRRRDRDHPDLPGHGRDIGIRPPLRVEVEIESIALLEEAHREAETEAELGADGIVWYSGSAAVFDCPGRDGYDDLTHIGSLEVVLRHEVS